MTDNASFTVTPPDLGSFIDSEPREPSATPQRPTSPLPGAHQQTAG
jgi:hypothetical protein